MQKNMLKGIGEIKKPCSRHEAKKEKEIAHVQNKEGKGEGWNHAKRSSNKLNGNN
jgi:hypothetical protein